MNILYFLGQFPKLSESFVINEIYELRQRGHEVAIFALDRSDDDLTHCELDELDITVEYGYLPNVRNSSELIATELVNAQVLRDALFGAKPQHHALLLHRAKQCLEFVRELPFDIDIVHTHFLRMQTYPSRYVASSLGVPQTATIHAFEIYDQPNMRVLKHLIERADHIVTISEYNRRFITEHITQATPISVIHAGVRPEKFCPKGNTIDGRVLTVARFIEKKGIRYALESISQLTDQIPHLQYHIVGSGPLQPKIKRLIDEYGLSEVVTILSQISDEKLTQEYDEAACFLLPCVVAESGDRDGIPVVLMEAMAMETPPISTTVSGIPELIDHEKNGLLVEPKNSTELAGQLASLLMDPNMQARLGEAGRTKLEHQFNTATEAEKLETLFTDLVQER